MYIYAVYVASLDTNWRPGDWKRLDLHLGNTYTPWPRWSGDSNQIVYTAMSQDAGRTGEEGVHLNNPSSGEDREIYQAAGDIYCDWAAQQPKLFCIDAADKTQIFSIAVESGEIARLHTFPGPARSVSPGFMDSVPGFSIFLCVIVAGASGMICLVQRRQPCLRLRCFRLISKVPHNLPVQGLRLLTKLFVTPRLVQQRPSSKSRGAEPSAAIL